MAEHLPGLRLGMKEDKVERALVDGLEPYGFKVYKLTTPGRSGVMDRMILWPKWSPAPPSFVELKRPGKEPRALQAAVADDWLCRGADVREYCDTHKKVYELCDTLLCGAVRRLPVCQQAALPTHILTAFNHASIRKVNGYG